MTDLSGQYLGRYYLADRLGEGGMATVYKGYDTRLERDVAVKIIRSAAFPAEELGQVLKRFEREAKSLAKLSHPNIVKVHDYGEHDGSPYLVMEYLPGGTLKKFIGKPLPWQDALRLLIPIARGVAYAHQRGILHRDIKPANILITEDGEPMLSDFGIAKLFEGEQTTALTGSGMAIGTPEYMAPEQWTGTTSPQSDLYSLGIVLYEMVTGRKPYVADTPAAILIKQATEPLPSPRQFSEDLPEALELVLIKSLAKEPEDRYTDLKAFIGALESLHENVPVVSALPTEQKQAEETYRILSKKPLTSVPTKALKQNDKAMRAVEATEEATREKTEGESTEDVERENVKRVAAEKAKREKAERKAARRAALAKNFSNLLIVLQATGPKAKPMIRVMGVTSVIIVLFWVGSWGVPKLASLVPTAKAGLTPTLHPTTIFTFTASPQPPTKTLTMTPTRASTSIPTSTPTPVYMEDLSYFNQNFENMDVISGWAFSSYPSSGYPRKYWTIEEDTDGNHVLVGNAPLDKEIWITTGSNTQWKDYAFEFLAKIMSDSAGSSFRVGVRSSNDINGMYGYELAFGKRWSLNRETCLFGADCSLTWLVEQAPTNITPSAWFAVRIDLYGPEIRVYVDGKFLHKTTDNTSLIGTVSFDVPPGTKVYFDDIRVTKLVKR